MAKMTRLGELEREVMAPLWSAPEPQTVRQVHEALAARRDLAYTTIMTVLQPLPAESKKALAAPAAVSSSCNQIPDSSPLGGFFAPSSESAISAVAKAAAVTTALPPASVPVALPRPSGPA